MATAMAAPMMHGADRRHDPPSARRSATPGGRADTIAIDLLRDLAPQCLLLYDGRHPDRDEWARHCQQQTEYALVATRGPATARRVVGSLEFRVLAGMTGEWGMIDRLYVAPAHRRQGIASRLLHAAIAFARARGLTMLRENIPNVLVRDRQIDCWHPHLPMGEGWGGLRSLGATVNACVRERQPCAIDGASRAGQARRAGEARAPERIGATLTLPLTRARREDCPPGRAAASSAALLDRLLVDLATAAGVPLAHPAAPATAKPGQPEVSGGQADGGGE